MWTHSHRTRTITDVTQRKRIDPRIALGRAVRKLRLKAGLSQESLADLAGINRTYIGDVERGKRNIALLNLVRISEALALPLSRLIAHMERPE